jgi:hypothetical protein
MHKIVTLEAAVSELIVVLLTHLLNKTLTHLCIRGMLASVVICCHLKKAPLFLSLEKIKKDRLFKEKNMYFTASLSRALQK